MEHTVKMQIPIYKQDAMDMDNTNSLRVKLQDQIEC